MDFTVPSGKNKQIEYIRLLQCRLIGEYVLISIIILIMNSFSFQ